MRNTITFNENLLNEAMEITGIHKEEQVVNTALSELVKLYKRRGMLSFMNSDVWENPETELQSVAR